MPQHAVIRVLIIEDKDADTEKAITIFHNLGLEIQSKITVWAAHNLEEIAAGERPAPHLIVLDLGFPNEAASEFCVTGNNRPSWRQFRSTCGRKWDNSIGHSWPFSRQCSGREIPRLGRVGKRVEARDRRPLELTVISQKQAATSSI
jgi:CheY-like chemotaxis protein